MPPLHIGVLLLPPIQLLDLAPIDLLAMTSRWYFAACNLPPSLLDAAIPDADLAITYIAPEGAEALGQTTAKVRLAVDARVGEESVAPGKLDVLFVPGPPPGTRPGEEVEEWFRGHVGAGVELVTVCTGVLVAAWAGVLEGKRATGPRGMVEMLRREWPGVRWVEKRYVNDGRVWTCGKLGGLGGEYVGFC